MYTGAFWKATFERVASTFVQTYFGLWLAGDLIFNVFEFNWVTGLGPALGAAILSLVKAVLAAQGGNPGPSLANEAVVASPSTSRHSAPEGPAGGVA